MGIISEILNIAWIAFVSVIVLFLLTKLMGRKQISQLSMFDYIIGISIGSIAAEMASELEDYHKPLTAMIVYALIAVILSRLECAFFTAQKLIAGKPLILYDDGKLFSKNLKISKLTVDDFLAQCRINGYYTLGSLKLAVLEPNGSISFLPLSAQRPLTPADMNIIPQQELLPVNVIINGKIIGKNLKDTGRDRAWLQKTLTAQGIKSPSKVTLATCDGEGNLSVY